MSEAHLTKIWQWLSVACVLFLITSVISLQGGTEFLGRLFGDKGGSASDNGPAVGYFGVIIGGALFLGAVMALLLYALRHGNHWHDRIPVIWLDGLDTTAWEAKIFQIFVLLVFLALPAAGIIRCMQEAESGDICEQDTKNIYRGMDTTLLWAPVAKEGKQMRLRKADSGEVPCTAGIELFPRSLTPLTVYGLPIAGGVGTILALVLIFVRKSRPTEAKAAES